MEWNTNCYNINLSLSTKEMLLLYKAILKSIWNLWYLIMENDLLFEHRNITKISKQIPCSNSFSKVIDASWYITNNTWDDLNMSYIRDEIRTFSQRYADKFEEHPNILTKNLIKSIKTHAD